MQEMQETRVQPLCQEGPREQKMATCSGILAWKIPGTEEPGGLQSMELHRVGQDSTGREGRGTGRLSSTLHRC